jgi:hypothetical protein
MTTSGTITFTETRDQIITNALTLLGAIAAGETATTADITNGAMFLNAMAKAWVAQGIHLWTEESGTLFLVLGQAQYNLIAGATGANASDGTGTPVETTLSAQGSGTSIVVTTSTGMTVGDNIGVVQNTGVIQWTTIASIASTTVGLNASISVSNSGNGVFTYTTQLPRVLSIQSARLRNASGFDIKMDIRPREDYNNIPQKLITGSPIILYYSPQLTQGQVFLWPTPSDVNSRVEITYLRQIQDFDASGDNPDFPQEWLEAITYNLAVRIAPAYGINLSSGGISGNPDILIQAKQYLDDMKAWDSEQPFTKIVPKPRY